MWGSDFTGLSNLDSLYNEQARREHPSCQAVCLSDVQFR